jgi:hypothetical protein
MNIPRKKKRPLLTRLAVWLLPALAVLLIAGFIAFRIWFNAYLKSDAFRGLIGGITAKQLKATGEYLPFSFADNAIYSDGFRAHGTSQASFSDLTADQIRAKINLGGLWHHAWEIDEITLQRLQVSMGHTTGAQPAAHPEQIPQESYAVPSLPKFKWLPDHVDLRKVIVQEADLSWGENTPQSGSINNALVTITPDGEAWKILCESGTISQKGCPDLTIDQANLRYQQPTLFITDAAMHYSSDSSVDVSGEVTFDKDFDVQTKLNNISITPFLRPDWRAKLKGNVSGDVRIRAALPLYAEPRIDGTLSLAKGELEALPVLDEIATFTSTERFRRVSLSKVSAKFTYENQKVTVTDLIAESEGLIRIEGGFVVENGLIDGTFQVGITPSSLQWLPSALQSRVFSASHDGYVWTTMRLTGPVDHPSEDLSKRLLTAAGGAVMDTIQGAIQQVPGSDSIPKTIPDAPKQLINDLLSPLLNK